MSDDYDEKSNDDIFSSAEEQHRIQTKISYTKIIIFFREINFTKFFFCEKWNAWTPKKKTEETLLDH